MIGVQVRSNILVRISEVDDLFSLPKLHLYFWINNDII